MSGGETGRVTRRDTLLMLAVPLLWGLNFLAIDLGMGEVPPLLFLAIRFVLVAFPAVLVIPRPDCSWRVLAGIGLFMSAGQFGLLYVSMDLGMPPGLASLVLQAQVVFTIVIASGVLREHPTRTQVVGVVIGVAGLVVVVLGRGGHVPLLALMVCLAAGLSWAIGNVIARASRSPGGLGVTVWSGLVVPAPILALSLLVDGPEGVVDGLRAFGWEAVLGTLYTVVFASFVGYAIFNTMISRYPGSAVVPWILLVPVVGILSAWLVVDERPAPGELAGGALLVLGVLVAQGVLSRRRNPTSGVAKSQKRDPESSEMAAACSQK